MQSTYKDKDKLKSIPLFEFPTGINYTVVTILCSTVCPLCLLD